MSAKKTIRDIKIEHKPQKHHKPIKEEKAMKEIASAKKAETQLSKKKPSTGGDSHARGRGLLWSLVLLMVAFLAIFIATMFARATVTLTPETDSATIDFSATAVREAGGDQLRFDVMVIEESLSQNLPATSSEQVQRKASGQITIFNEEKSEQRLREETRFESPEGLIFKTALGSTTVVPPAQGSTPGQVTVMVYADEPGEAYNIERTDFVIPGWREVTSPKFETQYARSETAITGGFVGLEKSVDPLEKETVLTALRNQIEERLEQSAQAQKTRDFVFFEEGTFINFHEVSEEPIGETDVALTQKASYTALLFSKQELSSVIAEAELEGYNGEAISITNFNELSFSFSGDDFNIAEDTSITFTFQGNADFEWVIQQGDLEEKLSGITKKDFQAMLREIPGISRAELSVRPFWKTRVPDDLGKIRVKFEGSKVEY